MKTMKLPSKFTVKNYMDAVNIFKYNDSSSQKIHQTNLSKIDSPLKSRVKPNLIKIHKPKKKDNNIKYVRNQENLSLLKRLLEVNDRKNRKIFSSNNPSRKIKRTLSQNKKLNNISFENELLLKKILDV